MARPSQSDQLATEQIKWYDSLKAKRNNTWSSNWQIISQYALPQDSNIQVTKTEGVSGWTDQIYDTTMIQAAQTLRSGQYMWLTPPNQPWAEYDVPEEMKAAKGKKDAALSDAQKWLGNASAVAMRELARCNFYSMASLSYLGVGVFGTDLLICEEGKKTALNFRHSRIGTYCIAEDDEGVVDSMGREFELTYRQVEMMFNKPDDVIPEQMVEAAKNGKSPEKTFKFLHRVFPREDSKRLRGRKDGANMPVASLYLSLDYKKVVREAGYEESPILCSRFDKWGTETPWGYSPSYLVLPEVRQLNYVQMFLDAVAELHAYPRVLVPTYLEGDVDLRAGGMTTFNPEVANGLPQEWATTSDYKMGMEMQAQRRQVVNDAFFTPAFKLLNSDPLLEKRMTAYEISQRQAENLSMFTPQFGRRITEFLNPLMLRVFGILLRKGKFGQPPDALLQDMGNGTKQLIAPQVVITSRIADALKALKNRGIEATMQFILPIAQVKPDVLDNYDLDDMARDYAENSGVPADNLRSLAGPNSVTTLRQARAQLQQQMRASAVTEQMAKAGSKLGSSPQWVQDQVQEKMGG